MKEFLTDKYCSLLCQDAAGAFAAFEALRELLNHEVRLTRPTVGCGGDQPSGKEMPFHWVRGHWKMQPHGPQHSLRKRLFVAPHMVRADLLDVPADQTVTTYHQ